MAGLFKKLAPIGGFAVGGPIGAGLAAGTTELASGGSLLDALGGGLSTGVMSLVNPPIQQPGPFNLPIPNTSGQEQSPFFGALPPESLISVLQPKRPLGASEATFSRRLKSKF